MKRFAHCCLLALCGAFAAGPALADWESSLLPSDFDHASNLANATKLADEKGKAVVLYYTRTNCPPCTVLQGNLRNPAIGAPFKAGYVFTAVWGTSINRSEREAYRSKFDIQSAPTWVFFTGKGEYVCTSRGGFESGEHGARLHEAVKVLLASDSRSASPRACL
jgi:thioredoxin-related protein